jgi:hypothetical protein
MAAYTWALRERRRKLRRIPDNVVHGDSCYRNWGCKCDVCLAGVRDANLRRQEERATSL